MSGALNPNPLNPKRDVTPNHQPLPRQQVAQLLQQAHQRQEQHTEAAPSSSSATSFPDFMNQTYAAPVPKPHVPGARRDRLMRCWGG